MAEVFTELDSVISENGRAFIARVCGAPMDDRVWQGWIEFTALDDGEIFRTPRETTQPSRADFAYWVSGLTPRYFDGALARALRPRPVVLERNPEIAAYEEPAPAVERPPIQPLIQPIDSILDPFSVYQKKGEHALRQQLHALASWHLANIIRAYELSERDAATLERTPADVLIDLIVTAVRAASDPPPS